MLSEKEHQDLLWKIDHIPSSITGKSRQNLRAEFRKKIHEHEIASQYPAFQPLPYELYFVNRRTTEETLIHLTQTIHSSTKFILDTESINIYKQANKPALIQLQIIRQQAPSYMILIEVCHAPRTTQTTFQLVQEFFDALFQTKNTIYIWGEISELTTFSEIGFFSLDQIQLAQDINLQKAFKKHWNDNHRHNSSLTEDDNRSKCTCETCVGIKPNNPWSLQDAVAQQLHKWLDKRQTRSPFDIGLDPELIRINSMQLSHRQTITRYAIYDCDAMYQLLIAMNSIENDQPSSSHHQTPTETSSRISTTATTRQTTTDPQPERILIDDDDSSDEINMFLFGRSTAAVPKQKKKPTNREVFLIETTAPSMDILENDDQLPSIERTPVMNHPSEQSPSHSNRYPSDWESRSISRDRLNEAKEPTERLTDDQKRKIHNRSCTRRQRQRYYKHEIIRHNIDPRFTISRMKKILRQLQIPFNVINTRTSSTTRRTTLFIGLREWQHVRRYEDKTRDLFTTTHYNELKSNEPRSFSSPRDNHRRHHHQR